MSKTIKGNPKLVRLTALKGWKAVKGFEYMDDKILVAEYFIYKHKLKVAELSIYGTLRMCSVFDYSTQRYTPTYDYKKFGYDVRNAMRFVYLMTLKQK